MSTNVLSLLLCWSSIYTMTSLYVYRITVIMLAHRSTVVLT